MALIGMIMLTAIAANAQKITEGDKKLSFLAGETSFKIQYIYDDMQVGEMSEADYREKKVSEMNAKQRGKGDKWEKNWVGAREFKYEPKFEELMNKYLKDENGYSSKDEKDAKYMIVVKTVLTEPGFNSVVVKKNPFCNYQISWVEIATGNVMASGNLDKIQGVMMNSSDFDFDPTNGIVECYAKAGKEIAKTMTKAMKSKK